MRLPITLSLILAAAASLRAEAPSIQGTMPEDYMPGLRPLLVEAVERSPNTIAASINLAALEASKYGSISQLLPQVGVGADYGVSHETISDGPPSTSKGLFYSASVSQNVFEWGALKNQLAISNLQIKVASRQFEDAYRLLAITLREQYMGIINKKILVRNQAFKQQISEESLAAQQVRFEAGSVSEAEVQGFKLDLEEARLMRDKAQEDYDNAKRIFMHLVGIESLNDDSIPTELPHPEFAAALADSILTGFVGDGIESTFQSEIYKMSIKEGDLNYSIAKVRLLPKVSAAASYSFSNYTSASTGSISQVGVQSEAYSIAANWSIFDGFATRGQKLSALAGKRLYERQRQTYVDQTIDLITDMRHQLGFSSRALSLAEVHNALIEAEVKRLNQDRSLGYASQATIDTGTLNFYATQYLMAYARMDYMSRWTEFISLAGIDPAIANISARYVR